MWQVLAFTLTLICAGIVCLAAIGIFIDRVRKRRYEAWQAEQEDKIPPCEMCGGTLIISETPFTIGDVPMTISTPCPFCCPEAWGDR